MTCSKITASILGSAVVLALGAAFLGGLIPDLAGAETWNGPTSQIVITTQPGVGLSALPNSLVTVRASGPTLGTTPTSIGTLTFSSDFSNDAHVITVIPGPYTVTATPSSSYAASYSSGCSGEALAGHTSSCTIIAEPWSDTTNTARLTVSVKVINTYNGGLIAGNIHMNVSGNHPSPATFAGSISGTTVRLGTGSYAVNPPQISEYTYSLSGNCSGSVNTGDSRYCLVTYDNSSYNPYGYAGSGLICTPSVQSAALGQTVSFSAYGGTGGYTWQTADRTYLNIGPVLTTSLQASGVQTVVVTSGSQSATCTVNVSGVYVAPSTTSYYYPQTVQNAYAYQQQTVSYQGGYLLSTTYAPGFPNTGFEPMDWAGLLVALLCVVASGVFLFAYAKQFSLFVR